MVAIRVWKYRDIFKNIKISKISWYFKIFLELVNQSIPIRCWRPKTRNKDNTKVCDSSCSWFSEMYFTNCDWSNKLHVVCHKQIIWNPIHIPFRRPSLGCYCRLYVGMQALESLDVFINHLIEVHLQVPATPTFDLVLIVKLTKGIINNTQCFIAIHW